MVDERLTRREVLTRGAGAVLVAGAAAAAGYLLHDSEGDAGLPAGWSPLRPGPAGTGGAAGRSAAETVTLPNYFAAVDFPSANPRISIATAGAESGAPQTAAGADSATIDRLVRAAVAGLDPARGMGRFVSSGDVVLIKPNVGFDRPPYLGATAHPEVVRALIRLCKQAGARKVLVTDNPIESPAACFAKSGIARVAREEGAEVVLPGRGDFELLALRDLADPARGEVLTRWPILYPPLQAATRLIGVAPVKDHNLADASMILKNWYGLLGGRRNQLHQAIHETISDLALAFSPTLVVADATRVMLRNGPTGGRISDVRPGGRLGRPAVIAAVDPVACDAWCYENLLGRDAARLAYLALAHDKIAPLTAAGRQRFAEHDWRRYQQAGRIVSSAL